MEFHEERCIPRHDLPLHHGRSGTRSRGTGQSSERKRDHDRPREGKVWLRQEERDIDLATLRFKGINFANSTLPLLMLPHLTHAGAALELSGEMVYRYIARFGWGLYQKDANRTPKKIEVSAHQIDLLLERLTVEDATHDPSIFNLRT